MVSVCFIAEYACCGQTAAEGPKKSYARPQAEVHVNYAASALL